MDKLPWKQGIERLQEEDVSLMEIYTGYTDELMLDYPQITPTDAKIIFRNALNRATVGQVIRREIEYYMEHGRFHS